MPDPTTPNSAESDEPTALARTANASTIKLLVQQRKTKRMMRTKYQKDADRMRQDADALTTALAALGHEEPADD